MRGGGEGVMHFLSYPPPRQELMGDRLPTSWYDVRSGYFNSRVFDDLICSIVEPVEAKLFSGSGAVISNFGSGSILYGPGTELFIICILNYILLIFYIYKSN